MKVIPFVYTSKCISSSIPLIIIELSEIYLPFDQYYVLTPYYATLKELLRTSTLVDQISCYMRLVTKECQKSTVPHGYDKCAAQYSNQPSAGPVADKSYVL